MQRFCSECGAPLSAAPPTCCEACGHAFFVDAKPGAGAVVVDSSGRFLALRRAHEPGFGEWGLPGGFADGEHPEVAAVREVAEETGLRVELGGLVGVYSDTYRYQGREFPILLVYYLATVRAGAGFCLDEREVSEARWFPLEDPPEFAFAHIDEVIADAARSVAKSELRP